MSVTRALGLLGFGMLLSVLLLGLLPFICIMNFAELYGDAELLSSPLLFFERWFGKKDKK